MSLFIEIILTCLPVVIQISSANYCSSSTDLYQAFNFGTNVFVGQGSRYIWKFDTKTIQTDDQVYTSKTIFGENSFNWVDTAFTINFNECDSTQESDRYCEVVNKAKDLVIAIGRREEAVSDSRRYGYLAFRMTGTDQLSRLDDTNEDIVWGLQSKGSLSGDFWVPLAGDLYYESGVFVRSRNELFVSVFDTSTYSDSKYHLMSHKLGKDGNWSDGWVEVAKIGFRGMFDVNGRVFGFNKKNIVFEFKWSDDNKITFEQISDMKELLNCFGNSSLVETPETTNHTTTLTTTSTTTSTTTFKSTFTTSTIPETTSAIISNPTTVTTSVTTLSSTPEVNLKTNDSEIRPIEEIMFEFENNSDSSEGETKLINTTENTTSINLMNRTFEGEDEEEPNDWTIIYIIAIILVIILTIFAIIYIIRQKSKSQIMYLNCRDKDMKSCEIPLNNNNKSLQ